MITISKVLYSLEKENWLLRGEPTNETEFNQMFYKIKISENGEKYESNNPSDFEVTWAEIESKKVELESAEPMRLLRLERNRKLAETDWMSFSDSPTMSTEWQTYRQSLRDLPSTASPSLDEDGNLTGVEWPPKPE